MATRSEVYDALDSERAYQDIRWANQQTKVPDLDSFALFVAGYTHKLVEKCSTTDDVKERLDFFRKVGALCVAAMEAYGAPHREGF